MLKSSRLFTSEQLKSIIDIGLIKNGRVLQKSKPNISLNQVPQIQTNQLRLGTRLFHTTLGNNNNSKDVDPIDKFDDEKSQMYEPEFNKYEEKNKKAFLETVKVYKTNVKNRAGHVDFMKAALRNMRQYGVHRDLESYKKILDVLPKGVYVCTNKIMADGMYFPRQQNVVLDLLEQMDINGVVPDVELGVIIKNIFGSLSHPYTKYCTVFYWGIKFKNASDYPLPSPLPSDGLTLAQLAIQRITSVDLQTKISVYETSTIKDSIDKTWIVSAQSPKQLKLIQNHARDQPVIVEGGDLVWLRDKCISYFVLKADGSPIPFKPPEKLKDIRDIRSRYFNPNYIQREERKPTVHEQDDGKIYAVCATGTSSKDSLLSWVRILQEKGNPILADVPVLFRFKEPERLPVVVDESLVRQTTQS